MRVCSTSWHLLYKKRNLARQKANYARGSKFTRPHGARKVRRKWKNYGGHSHEKKIQVCIDAMNYYASTMPVN